MFFSDVRANEKGLIDEKREKIIEQVLSNLHGLLDTYRDPNYRCVYGQDVSFECGAMQLGALTKEMEAWGLFAHMEPPFEGICIAELCSKVRSMRSPRWRDRNRYGFHNCNFEQKLRSLVENAEKGMESLKLEDNLIPISPRLLTAAVDEVWMDAESGARPPRIEVQIPEGAELKMDGTNESEEVLQDRQDRGQGENEGGRRDSSRLTGMWRMAYVSTFSPYRT